MSEATANQYNIRLNKFELFLLKQYGESLDAVIDKIKQEKVNPYDILNSFCAYLRPQNLSTSTITYHIVTAKNFLEFHDVEISPRKFKLKVKLPKTVRRNKEALSKQEIIEILNACSNIRLKTYVMFLAATGCRSGEATSIRLKDIQFNKRPATVFHMLGLFTWVDVSSVIIVSMVSFFGATAKTPISSIIMGSELTGGYALLAPMMLATFIAYIMSGQHSSIFRNQVINRSDSPAHKREYQRPILRDLYVKDVYKKTLTKLSPDNSIEEALQTMNHDRTKSATVVNENDRLLGVVNRHKFFEFPEEYRKSVKLDSVMIKDPFFAYVTDTLHDALVRLSSNELQEMPVLSNEDRVLGIVTISDVVKLYDKEVEKVMEIRKDNDSIISSSMDDSDTTNSNPNRNLKKQ